MRHRRHLPEVVRTLRTGERRLAWGLTDNGLPLVAVPTGLYVGDELLPWTQVEKASWKPDVLTVTEVAEVEGTGRVRSFSLVEDDHLAETVRTQVTSSVGWSDRRTLVPSGAVRLVGRRVVGEDRLQWQVVWEPGTDRHDPALRAQVEQHLEALRRSIG